MVADLVSGPSCSAKHVPGYINHPKLKDAGRVFVVSVNDPFVYGSKYSAFHGFLAEHTPTLILTTIIRLKAWSSNLDPTSQSGVSIHPIIQAFPSLRLPTSVVGLFKTIADRRSRY